MPQVAIINQNPAPSLPDPNLLDYNFGGQSQYLFGRSWAFSIGLPGSPGNLYAMQSVGDSPAQFTTNLRIEMDIQKTSLSSSNKAKFKIYNFSDQSRQSYVKGLQFTLNAGYQNIVDTIFVGNISSRVMQERKGNLIITSFECGDGEQELYSNYINNTYPKKTPAQKIITDLVSGLGLSVGVVSGLQNVIYNNGFIASGGIKQILDRMLKKQNLEWSVQNGQVQIIPIKSHNGDTAVVVNQTTGLIGVPSKADGGDSIVTFSSLMNPKLVPGVPVQLTSDLFSGIFKVKNAHFDADSHGPKWQVTCECVPIAVTPATAINLGIKKSA